MFQLRSGPAFPAVVLCFRMRKSTYRRNYDGREGEEDWHLHHYKEDVVPDHLSYKTAIAIEICNAASKSKCAGSERTKIERQQPRKGNRHTLKFTSDIFRHLLETIEPWTNETRIQSGSVLS